ncbi:unnamed protein product [Mytilus coruscus]|uniref:Uncharacterized protein n=1 Tax=Mytilus coruscus TaxID=42192 RepID=A0A6J8CI54_MYTCO|nr:unnamed protein product [Mytilus coruscus]
MILLINLCLFSQIVTVLAAVCGDSTIGVADPPSSYSGNTDSNSNTAYVMTDAAVKFSCCGMIKMWKFYASRSGTIKLQVWRTWFNTNFTLVAENAFVVPVDAVNQEIHYEVAEEHRIQINNNDYIGWHTTGDGIIPYSGRATPDNTYYIRTSVSVDSTYPFTSNYDNRVYAIVAVVTAKMGQQIRLLGPGRKKNDEEVRKEGTGSKGGQTRADSEVARPALGNIPSDGGVKETKSQYGDGMILTLERKG